MPSSDDEPETFLWKAAYVLGWALLAVFGIAFGVMCAAGVFFISGER